MPDSVYDLTVSIICVYNLILRFGWPIVRFFSPLICTRPEPLDTERDCVYYIIVQILDLLPIYQYFKKVQSVESYQVVVGMKHK